VNKQGFSHTINCTKVKQTATKLHKSPDKTDRSQSQSLLQMTNSDSNSGPKPGLRGTPAIKNKEYVSLYETSCISCCKPSYFTSHL